MENPLNITALNDFIFCPISIYFHNLYTDTDKTLYQTTDQINGSYAHRNTDNNTYTNAEKVIQSLSVYSEEYNLIGKIDMYYPATHKLVERKKKIIRIYDGYIFQIYGQYFAMKEMGYQVNQLFLRSIDDNKNYAVDLPENNIAMYNKFKMLITNINEFDMRSFRQNNSIKCTHCIYKSICDRGE